AAWLQLLTDAAAAAAAADSELLRSEADPIHPARIYGELLPRLAEDAVLIGDTGASGGRYGKIRNVGRPVTGRAKVVALVKALARQAVERADIQERVLNGQPGVVVFRNGRAIGAILVAVADGKIRHVYMQFDSRRLKHVGQMN
ncbi:MAG TPA: hypothetical protein VIF09_01500, partial [Polyangiaceae bacterium]